MLTTGKKILTMPPFQKIAVTRATILFHFRDDELEEYKTMNDEELLENFMGAGYFENEEEVYPVIYKGQLFDGCIDAEKVGNVTGWPCSLESYYAMTKK